jgi:hypothetical protein
MKSLIIVERLIFGFIVGRGEVGRSGNWKRYKRSLELGCNCCLLRFLVVVELGIFGIKVT